MHTCILARFRCGYVRVQAHISQGRTKRSETLHLVPMSNIGWQGLVWAYAVATAASESKPSRTSGLPTWSFFNDKLKYSNDSQLDWLWSHALDFGHSPWVSKKLRFWEQHPYSPHWSKCECQETIDPQTWRQSRWQAAGQCDANAARWTLRVTPVLPVTGRAFANDFQAPGGAQ